MDYMFYDASVRSTRALKLVKGQPILQGYLAAEFKGNADQLVVFDFNPRPVSASSTPTWTLSPDAFRHHARCGRILQPFSHPGRK